MPRYSLSVSYHGNKANGKFIVKGDSPAEVISAWKKKHPNVKIESIKEIYEIILTDEKPANGMTPRRWRNHHKARITQMRNNAISLIDDEDAVITDSERLQLSRIACQLDRILALWPTRQYELNLNHK